MNPKCPQCQGKGQIVSPAGNYQICPTCDGNGEDPGVPRFFTYTSGVISLTANQVLLAQRIQIRGDAPFRIELLTRIKTGSFRIRLFDSTGQYWSSTGVGGSNDRVPDVNLFGDGSLPFLIAYPVIIPAGGTINFDIEDTSGNPNAVELSFHGAKLYPTPAKN